MSGDCDRLAPVCGRLAMQAVRTRRDSRLRGIGSGLVGLLGRSLDAAAKYIAGRRLLRCCLIIDAQKMS